MCCSFNFRPGSLPNNNTIRSSQPSRGNACQATEYVPSPCRRMSVASVLNLDS
ncbi:hypothetical protein BDW68DRAFT_152554 [Aspergillus falconensis]